MKERLQKNRKGFTLMELMIVIIILGLLAAVVMPSLTGKSEEAKRKLVCVQMKNLSEAVKMFKIENGRYPTTEEGLKALVENPAPDELTSYSQMGYLEDGKVPNDPWKHPYIYTFDEENGNFDIISMGQDGKEGGKKEAADIYLSKCQ
jgi:general secretion pathway protein G